MLPVPNSDLERDPRELTVTVQMEDGLQPEYIATVTFFPEATILPAEQPIGNQRVSITEMTADEVKKCLVS